ncbi:MAG: hypothetical protein OXT65_10620 [Alphaproteobacteria bacterium]|nr:hypothetical protein [Alphaproteobacteria bacterium]
MLDDGTFTFTLHHKALLQVRGKISWALDGGSVVTAFLRMHWLQRIFISIWAAFILFSGLLDPSDRSGSELFVMLIMISFMIFLPYKIFQIFARKEFAAWERFFADVLKA